MYTASRRPLSTVCLATMSWPALTTSLPSVWRHRRSWTSDSLMGLRASKTTSANASYFSIYALPHFRDTLRPVLNRQWHCHSACLPFPRAITTQGSKETCHITANDQRLPIGRCIINLHRRIQRGPEY